MYTIFSYIQLAGITHNHLSMGEQVFESTIKVTISDDVENIIHSSTKDVNKKSVSSNTLLTKLHAGYFRISLSLGGQTLLWKVLAQHLDKSQTLQHKFHSLPSTTFLLLWWTSLCALMLLSFLYILRCIFHFKLVKSEFLHPIGVNYLFAPWISWLLLLQSMPFTIPNNILDSCQVLWWIFVVPVVILDVKIYGQWFTTEKRFLSMVANPTSQLSILGNLVGSWIASKMEWKESAICIFTLGLTHYLVVFITLYQRLSGTNRLPAILRPSFFLFVAAPSMASLAWASISGDFDMPCRMLFFLSLFLFISLVCRPTLFKKSMRKFNVAWWAYSFPLTFLALASTKYAHQVGGHVAAGLMLLLSALSILVFVGLTVATTLNLDMLLHDHDRYLNFTKST